MNFESNSSFSSTLQIGWDSTSLSALKTCPRLYFYSIICGYAPRQANVHLTFGLLFHSALEHYDHQRAREVDHDEAVLRVVKKLMIETWDTTLSRPMAVLCEDPNKNRFSLVRTVVWYLENFREDPLKTVILANGKPAVELSFRFETEYKTADGTPFLYCGHQDRLVSFNDETCILDRKTTKHTISPSFFEQFTPHNQFTGYILGGQVLHPENPPKRLIVDAAQVAATFSRFERGLVERSEFQLNEWYESLGYWLKLAEGFAKANYWPMNESACGNYGGCPFRGPCSRKTENVRKAFLESGFVRRVWDPLKARGDI